ncbi:MAG: virulence protein RhuM/Fic/DOC family protein [Flavobacteriia bacterium]|nr:virulence protein RhuM/Fic/DOC family protein [Flavobacteriia bacterium]
MNEILIYQSNDNQTQIEVQFENDTVWLTQSQMTTLFNQTKQSISLHINNCFKEGELNKAGTVKESLTVQIEGNRRVKRKIDYYNLDVIISVGYRVKSKQGTQFRQWATQRLKDYLVQGYALNQKRIEENKFKFLQTLEELKLLAQNNTQLEAKDIILLIQNFSNTFFALDSYDKNEFPKQGEQKEIETNAQELQKDLQHLKYELIKKGEATELFAQEKVQGNLEGIFGTVFQSVFGQDAYPTVEEKVAHLLYFIVKNHPFNDGNKRSGAFSFVWLLHKAGYNFKNKISPETLTTLTILIAESNPNEKDRMVGIVQLLLNTNK